MDDSNISRLGLPYLKWYVLVRNGWKPNDPQVMSITSEQWSIYFLMMQRMDMVMINRQRMLVELNAGICNPEVYDIYRKNKGKTQTEIEDIFKMDGLVPEIVDNSGTRLPIYELDKMVSNIKEFKPQG